MNILYIIGNIKGRNTGKGGSFHSSASVAKALSNNHAVKFVVLGDFKSQAVEQILDNNYTFIKTGSFWKKIVAFFQLLKLIVKFRPQIVHIFGSNVLIFAYFSTLFMKSKIVFTKCGKGNSEGNESYSSNVIALSQENYIFLKKLLNNGVIQRLTFIPNRIFPFDQNSCLIDELKNDYNIGVEDFVIMRLGRIDKYYEVGINQTIKYYNELKTKKSSAKLLLVGNKSDNIVLRDEDLDSNVFIINQAKYTNNPKALLSVADIVIANGRCTMEACYVGESILVPSQKEGLIPITSHNWKELLHFNFSERSVTGIPIVSVDENQKSLKEIFDENFNIMEAVPRFEKFYEEAVTEKLFLKKLLVWLFIYFKKF